MAASHERTVAVYDKPRHPPYAQTSAPGVVLGTNQKGIQADVGKVESMSLLPTAAEIRRFKSPKHKTPIFRIDKKRLFINAFAKFFPELPQPNSEHKFHPTRNWRFDAAWFEKKIAVEIEGGTWINMPSHASGKGIQRDCEKTNEAVILGWRVLRFTTTMLRIDPYGCCKKVAGLLA